MDWILLEAVQKQKLEKVKTALVNGADASLKNFYGDTALTLAQKALLLLTALEI